MMKEFAKFLKEFKVASLMIAFIMGEASSSLVSSLVKDIILPIAAPLMSAESWREASFKIGSITIAYGTVLADVLNFIIVAFLVFIIARKLLRLEAESKK